MKVLGQRLRLLRESVRLSQAKLAEIKKKVDAADQLGVAINYVPFTAYEMAQNYLYECDKDGFFKSKAMMHHFIKSFFK